VRSGEEFGEMEEGQKTLLAEDAKYLEEVGERIEKNKALIAEARQTIDQMRALFKSIGADLDSGRNIFLESPTLTPEDREQTRAIIAKMEDEYEARYQEYLNSVRDLPNEDRPQSLKAALEEDQWRYRNAEKKPTSRRFVKKMHL
jgi:hypothetical protein